MLPWLKKRVPLALVDRPEDPLNQVDLAFVVDTTGSMGAFINAARQQMVDTLKALTAAAVQPVDLAVGIVEYRDHPPQDNSFVFQVYAFTANLAQAQKSIEKLKPNGGGDGPEAVYDGLRAACTELKWRQHSHRLAILVGDAPPHGWQRGGDAFPAGCPCGLDPDQVTALFEAQRVALYAVGLTQVVPEIFTRLARFTGGEYFPAQRGEAAIAAIQGLLSAEFADLDFDRQVLATCALQEAWTIDSLCQTLESPRGRVSASLSRLGRRGLLE
jgi:hypothetical protein